MRVCPYFVADLHPKMRLRLSAMQSLFSGEDAAATAQRLGLCEGVIDACAAIVRHGGADVFLDMLTQTQTAWQLPQDELPHKPRKKAPRLTPDAQATPGVLPPLPIAAPKVLLTPLVATPPRTQSPEPLRQSINMAASFERAREGIASFAAQDPDILTPPHTQDARDYFAYVAGLRCLDTLADDLLVWDNAMPAEVNLSTF